MVVKTKCFGEIEIGEEKIITFETGLFGFEEYKNYTILFDLEKEGKERISWLQSLEEPTLACPMISPLAVKDDYNPSVSEGELKALEPLTEENMAMFLILTVPGDITKMTANLKAPIVINSDTRVGAQVVADNSQYQVRYEVFSKLTSKEEAAC